MTRTMIRLAVCRSSATAVDPHHLELADDVGASFFQSRIGLVDSAKAKAGIVLEDLAAKATA